MPILRQAPPMALSTEQLSKVFKDYDKNGDGRLDKEELKKAFKKLGAFIPGWRAKRGLQHADADGDGFITESEMSGLVKYALQIGYTLA